jgi:hypothetical protein
MSACCALLNPFDDNCKGCKWPDGNNGRSIPVQVRATTTLTTNAAGYGFIQFTPTVPYGFVGTASVGSTYTLGNTGTYTVPTFFSNFAQYRIVCWGIKISVISSVPNTQGKMILSTISAPLATGTTYTSGTMDASSVESVPLSTGREVVWVSKRTGAATFVNAVNSPGTIEYNNFTSLIVDVYGAVPSTVVLDFEYSINLEGILNTASSGLSHLAPKDPPANGKLTDAVSKAAEKIPNIVEGGINTFTAAAEKAAMSAFEKGGEYLLEGLAGMFI